MNTLEYLQNLLDTISANIDAGNLKPDAAYHAECDCISCQAYTELMRLCREIAEQVPACFFAPPTHPNIFACPVCGQPVQYDRTETDEFFACTRGCGAVTVLEKQGEAHV